MGVTSRSCRSSNIRDSIRGTLIECGVIEVVGVADFYMAARAAADFLSGINLFEAPDRESLGRPVNERGLPLMG